MRIARDETWSGAIDSATGLGIQHGIMLPAMLGVMLWRYEEYAHPHHTAHALTAWAESVSRVTRPDLSLERRRS